MKISDGNLNQLKRLEESLWIEETRFDKEYMNKVLALGSHLIFEDVF